MNAARPGARDSSAPDVGRNTQDGHVPLHQRTTPAGRFVAEPGKNLQGETVLWVAYDVAFAIASVVYVLPERGGSCWRGGSRPPRPAPSDSN